MSSFPFVQKHEISKSLGGLKGSAMEFRMTHNNINVVDLEKSLDFYKKAFGLKPAEIYEPDDHSFKIAYLSDGKSDWRLELTWLADRDTPYDLGDNEIHLGLSVTDYKAAHEMHEKMGCICYENDEMDCYFVEDPDGYWVEVEPAR